MSKYSMKIYEENFSHKTESKKAYLKACKWLAQNVISRDELKNVMYNISKDEEEQFPTFKVTLYVSVDEVDVREKHCKICEELHRSIFMNDNCNCAWCQSKAFEKRAKEMVTNKKRYALSILNDKWEE